MDQTHASLAALGQSGRAEADLGTPLSRLAFHVEGLPEVARARAVADVDEMRAMIGAAIGYARDELVDGATRRFDLGSLLDSLVEDTRAAGDDVTIIPGPRIVVVGDPAALRRLFASRHRRTAW